MDCHVRVTRKRSLTFSRHYEEEGHLTIRLNLDLPRVTSETSSNFAHRYPPGHSADESCRYLEVVVIVHLILTMPCSRKALWERDMLW